MATFDVEYKTEATGDAIQSKLFESNAATTMEVAEEFQKAHPEATDVTQVVECEESPEPDEDTFEEGEDEDDKGLEDEDDTCPDCGQALEDCDCDDEPLEDEDDDSDDDDMC